MRESTYNPSGSTSEKNTSGNHAWERKCQKTSPLEVQMDDLAATTAYSFSPGWPFGRYMGTQISKNTFRACIFRKSSSNVHLNTSFFHIFKQYVCGFIFRIQTSFRARIRQQTTSPDLQAPLIWTYVPGGGLSSQLNIL